MGYRKFVDRDGNEWDVRVRTPSEWEFQPGGGNRERARLVQAPTYERDPFELSNEELQKLLDTEGPPRSGRPKSPFSN